MATQLKTTIKMYYPLNNFQTATGSVWLQLLTEPTSTLIHVIFKMHSLCYIHTNQTHYCSILGPLKLRLLQKQRLLETDADPHGALLSQRPSLITLLSHERFWFSPLTVSG